MPTDHTSAAIELMARFADRTGLVSGGGARRYLWTDAFAACNFSGLARSGAGEGFDELALRTVERVHEHLAHFRSDDSRSGWLCGPHGTADADHPTRAGLRIGKPLPERGPGERFDERLEWDRDGQYFHYLTRWMHALGQLARADAGERFGRWARELADTAHRAFTYPLPGDRKRMYWKMSTDLSRPLVPSMGQHDPLDGLMTALSLRTADSPGPDLAQALDDYAAMLDTGALATADPLGLGGLLMDAFRLEQLMQAGAAGHEPLLGHMLESAAAGLRHGPLASQAPAQARLGFRELGLAIGLAALARMTARTETGQFAGDARARQLVQGLRAHLPLRESINAFWLAASNREAASWTEHLDINEVMLATSLAPDGWLELGMTQARAS